jgi:hypothetical protein
MGSQTKLIAEEGNIISTSDKRQEGDIGLVYLDDEPVFMKMVEKPIEVRRDGIRLAEWYGFPVFDQSGIVQETGPGLRLGFGQINYSDIYFSSAVSIMVALEKGNAGWFAHVVSTQDFYRDEDDWVSVPEEPGPLVEELVWKINQAITKRQECDLKSDVKRLEALDAYFEYSVWSDKNI